MKDIWLLTEERPKISVIHIIIDKFCNEFNFECIISDIKIIPIFFEGKFLFKYKVEGIKSNDFNNIFIKIISGKSSFVDYLFFFEEKEPTFDSAPIYAIEETKTNDSESRNTGVYQRCSKFVYIDEFFPKTKKVLLYNIQIKQKEKPTDTNIFGTRLLLTIGVEILGKENINNRNFKKFDSIDEIIEEKNKMAKPHYGTPVNIVKKDGVIFISSRLEKAGKLGSDPSIGQVSIISFVLRKLGWKGKIVITEHGLKNQASVGKRNKFILIANKLNIELDGLAIPKVKPRIIYWEYETKQEKLSTILLHLIIDLLPDAEVIYENHGGCERGYFYDSEENPIALEKYQEGKRAEYKKGDKSMIIYIPDIIIYDKKNNIIINVEGKTYNNIKIGIKELQNYDYIENEIIRKYYNPDEIIRTLAIYGGKSNEINNKEIGFLLSEDGEVVLGKKAPKVFIRAIENLKSF